MLYRLCRLDNRLVPAKNTNFKLSIQRGNSTVYTYVFSLFKYSIEWLFYRGRGRKLYFVEYIYICM